MEKKRAQGLLVLSILTASCLVWSANSPKELDVEYIHRESGVLGLQPGMEYTMTEGALDFEHKERFLQTLSSGVQDPAQRRAMDADVTGKWCSLILVSRHRSQIRRWHKKDFYFLIMFGRG